MSAFYSEIPERIQAYILETCRFPHSLRALEATRRGDPPKVDFTPYLKSLVSQGWILEVKSDSKVKYDTTKNGKSQIERLEKIADHIEFEQEEKQKEIIRDKKFAALDADQARRRAEPIPTIDVGEILPDQNAPLQTPANPNLKRPPPPSGPKGQHDCFWDTAIELTRKTKQGWWKAGDLRKESGTSRQPKTISDWCTALANAPEKWLEKQGDRQQREYRVNKKYF